MLTHRNKYIFFLAVLNCLLTTLLIIYWKIIFKDVRSVVGITFALILFFLCELFVILYTERKIGFLSARQSINLFLGYKAGKMFLAFLFLAVYVAIVRVEQRRFIMIFLIFYLIYLLFDTIYLASREKSLRIKNKE